MRVRSYRVDVCDGCMRLEGEECHTPGCVFFLRGIREIEEILNTTLLRPKANGSQIFTSEEAISMSIAV